MCSLFKYVQPFQSTKSKELNTQAKSRITFVAPPLTLPKEKKKRKKTWNEKEFGIDLRVNKPSISSSCHCNVFEERGLTPELDAVGIADIT